jgi:hypothetical protein
LHLIDLFVVAVPLVAVPLGSLVLPTPFPVWMAVVTGLLLVPSFLADQGSNLAIILVVPWAALAAAWATRAVVEWRKAPSLDAVRLSELAAPVFLFGSTLALVGTRSGSTISPIHEPIVELTAVHYGFAAYGATIVAGAAAAVARNRWPRLAPTAVYTVVVSPVLIAIGFFTQQAIFQVGAAVTLTGGVWAVALLTFVEGRRRASDRWSAGLLTVSALSPLVPMVLAVMWAASQYWSIPALSINAMAKTHAPLNAFGFVGCGLLGFSRMAT